MSQIMLMLGTRKGAFLAFSNPERLQWKLTGPFFKGMEVSHLADWGTDSPSLIASLKNEWWGPGVRFSRDFGQSWTEPKRDVRFEEDRDLSVERVWVSVRDVRSSEATLYAGVDPAALFRSTDGGESWQEVQALTDHPTRGQWQPGAGGLMVHCICFDPNNSKRMYVAISAAGVFRTDDGGKSWTPKNKGVRTDFLPEKFPQVGQCTHHLIIHPSQPQILYQQNHCGVYRSENAGDDWIDISGGLPARFGFPIAAHPHDGNTIYVIPEESDHSRITPDGALRVYRSRNRGDSWEPLTRGLPQSNAYENVLRAAMNTDSFHPAGIYVGTQGGRLFASRDEGEQWELLFSNLPPIYSVEATVLDS